MKITWLAPYDINQLGAFIKAKKKPPSHACSWIVNLADALAKRSEIELHIITLSPHVCRDQAVQANNISFHFLKSGFPFIGHGFPAYFPLDVLTGFYLEVRKVVSQIEKIKPDLVHAHGTEYAYGLSAISSGVPFLLSIQGVITEYHKVDKSFRNLVVSYLEQNQIKRCKYFACRTKFDSDFVKTHNPNAEIFTLQEAVNNVYFKANWQDEDSKIILFVGALCKRKGVEVLLKSLPYVKKIVPGVSLCLIGNGAKKYISYLRDLSRKLGVEGNVRFLGFKTPQEIAEWHIKSCMLVLPTYSDNSPNSVFEAMVSGLPVISTKTGGLPSIIEDRKTGLLVDPGNAEALSQEIIYLFKNSHVRKYLSEQSRMAARELHSPEYVASEAIKIYKHIIQEAKS